MHVDILNPKAVKLLRDLADMNLIAIRSEDNDLMDAVQAIRSKVTSPPSLEDITTEVETVRAERYARSKKQDNH
jgi:hypothetical protein